MINGNTMDHAEVTYCYERDIQAGGVQVTRPLPWAFIRFGDTNEEQKYVAPTGSLGLTMPGRGVFRAFQEFMPSRAFPLETSRPARVNNADDVNRPGPIGVHFFGAV